MEVVSVKFEESVLEDIESAKKKHRYATRAEFIREAIRDKLKGLEREEAIKKIRELQGFRKKKTTKAQLKKAREAIQTHVSR